MKQYFYNREASVLVCFDTSDDTITELEHLGDIEDEVDDTEVLPAPQPKRKYAKRQPATAENRQWNGGVDANHDASGKPKRSITCKECGETGHFAKTCPNKGDGTLPRDNKRDEAMSAMNFGRVKISQSHDIPAATIANNLDVPVEEVELAFTFESYQDYLKT